MAGSPGPNGSTPAPTPRVDVVIPCGGRWPFVHTAVRAVLAQVGVEATPIVVVNGPAAADDDAVAALEAAGARVLRRDEAGVAAARNAGLDAVTADHVAILDDDDLWAPDKLRAQLDALEEQGAVFAYSSAIVVDADLAVQWAEPAPDPAELERRMVENNPIPACSSNLLVRSDVARAVRFDPDLKHLADWDFAARLIVSGPGAADPEHHVAYVWHPDNMHTTDLHGIEEEIALFQRRHAAAGRAMGGPSQVRWLAGAYRRSGLRGRAARAYLRGAVRYRSAPDAVRAGAVLLGERAMALGADRRAVPTVPAPGWLAAYR